MILITMNVKGVEYYEGVKKKLENYLLFFDEVDTKDGKLYVFDTNNAQKITLDSIVKDVMQCAIALNLDQPVVNKEKVNKSKNAFITYCMEEIQANKLDNDEHATKRHFIQAVVGEVSAELRAMLGAPDNKGDEVLTSKKSMYTSIEEMMAKFPLKLTDTQKRIIQEDGGKGVRQVTLEDENFIINRLKTVGYDINIVNNVKLLNEQHRTHHDADKTAVRSGWIRSADKTTVADAIRKASDTQ